MAAAGAEECSERCFVWAAVRKDTETLVFVRKRKHFLLFFLFWQGPTTSPQILHAVYQQVKHILVTFREVTAAMASNKWDHVAHADL